MTLLERFEEKYMTEPNTGCWLWSASSLPNNSYGQFYFKGKVQLAHRVSYILFKGEVGSLCVLHKCDIQCCVNPDHLFLGTYKDNANDRDRKDRGANMVGENNPHSKLTNYDIDKIRELLTSGLYQKDIAKLYNVSAQHISKIKCGKTRG